MLPQNLALESLSVKTEILSEKCTLHMVNMQMLVPDIVSAFDSVIVEICEGRSKSEIENVKKRLLNYLENKKGSSLELGSIAEFICHTILKKVGFRQEFLYLNLEEGSVKKGFDGFYTYDQKKWLMEIKSGTIKTKNISHESKIKKAYIDLKNKLAGKKIKGKTQNDPWRNAYNHACHSDVRTEKSIREELRLLSEEYLNGNFFHIKDNNIIPGSTIFLENIWAPIEYDILKKQISDTVKEFECVSIHVVCINNISKDLFLEYLKA